MLTKIFQKFSGPVLRFAFPVQNYITIPSRCFARRKSSPPSFEDPKDKKISQLWKELENTEIGRMIDELAAQETSKGKTENDLIREYLDTQDLEKKIPNNPEKIKKTKDGNREFTASGPKKEVEIGNLKIDSELEAKFEKEIERLSRENKIDFLRDLEELQKMTEEYSKQAESEGSKPVHHVKLPPPPKTQDHKDTPPISKKAAKRLAKNKRKPKEF